MGSEPEKQLGMKSGSVHRLVIVLGLFLAIFIPIVKLISIYRGLNFATLLRNGLLVAAVGGAYGVAIGWCFTLLRRWLPSWFSKRKMSDAPPN
jgi:hypothetical protein